MVTSYAQLEFAGGPGIHWRIDPSSINWGFSVNSTVIPTVGGRVVQVTGATLSDMTISGYFGEDHSKANGSLEYPGRSWRLAMDFANQIRTMMNFQSKDATTQAKMHPTAVFTFAPLGIKFNVYLKSFSDPDGGAITLKADKFSHRYQLVLFIVQDGSDALVKAGAANGVLNKAKAAAINQYVARISNGIGWQPSKYNGNFKSYYSDLGMFPDADTGATG